MPVYRRTRRNARAPRRRTRRTYTRRTARTRTTLRRVNRRVSRIQRNFAPEFKCMDWDLNAYDETHQPDSMWVVKASSTLGIPGIEGSAPAVPGYMSVAIPGLNQGIQIDARVGNQVLYRHLQITGVASCYNQGADGGTFAASMVNWSGYLRIYVVLDKQAHVGLTASPVPYIYDHDTNGEYSISSRKKPFIANRYQFIAAKTYSLSMGQRPSANINIQIPMRRVMHYASSQPDAQANQCFHVYALVNQSLDGAGGLPMKPSFALKLNARVRYVDC